MEQSHRFGTNSQPADCPAGRPLGQCDTTRRVLSGVGDFLDFAELLDLPNLVRRNRLLYLNLGCAACGLNCAPSLVIDGAKVTAIELEFSGPGGLLSSEGQ